MVNQENYNRRGNDNSGIVLRCRKIAGNHLVYFDRNSAGGWAIYDFMSGFVLRSTFSRLTIEEIENDADHDEFPPWANVERDRREWEVYLRLRTTAVFRLRRVPIIKRPNSDWKRL